jgi:protein TonB
MVKFLPPAPAPIEEVVEEPPTVKELEKADPGPKTIEGDPTAEVRIDEPVGNAPKEAEVTEDNTPVDFVSIENPPVFPGGQEAMAKFILKNFNWPSAAQDAGLSGRIYMSFIVEKDGSLTDIKVLRDLGMGTGEEAIRVLKKMPKWKPGIQNGRGVRVAFTLPLSLSVSQ